MKEMRQHALEQALQEIVGGRTPPDRTFSILAAVHRVREQRHLSPRRRSRGIPWALGAALGAAAALLVFFPTQATGPDRGELPPLQVQILEAALAWQTQETGAMRRAEPGSPLSIIPRIGDRVLADPFRHTRARLSDFGTLTMTPGTQLEIEDMKWQEFGIGFGSGSLTVAVLVGSMSWIADGANADAAPGDSLELAMHGPAARVETSAEQARQLEEDLAAARAEIERLEAAVQRRPVELPPLVAEPTPDPTDDFEPLELSPELDSLLASVDWRAVGEQSIEMRGTLGRLMALLAAGEEIPQELIGELERLQGTLHEHGAVLDGTDLIPGTNFDTQVRHPLVGAQWMTVLLDSAGLPLDDVQRQALQDLARRYTAEDEQRRAGYGEETSLIQKYIDELEMQDRFYRDGGLLMGDAQRELFSAGEFEGRVGAKLVGEASMAWGEWAQPVVVRTRDEFASSMTTGFANALGLQGAQRSALQAAVVHWSQAFPAEWWDRPYGDLDRYGGYQVERLKVAAQLQLQFFDQVRRTAGLTSEQLQILAKVRSLVVPYQRN